MRGDRDSNSGPSGHSGKTLPLAPGLPFWNNTWNNKSGKNILIELYVISLCLIIHGETIKRGRDVNTRSIKLLFMDLTKSQQYDIFHCPSSQTETSKPRLFVLRDDIKRWTSTFTLSGVHCDHSAYALKSYLHLPFSVMIHQQFENLQVSTLHFSVRYRSHSTTKKKWTCWKP